MMLYGSLTSPFVRKCRITAMEAGLADRLDFVLTVVMDDAGDHPNPLNLVPSLETDEGELILDSRVICDYLAAQGRNDALADGAAWEDRTLAAMADGLMDRAVAVALEQRRPESRQSEDWQFRRINAIRNTLPELERRLPVDFTPGAIALVCALGYLDLRHDDLDWRSGHAAMADWFAARAQRLSVAETEPPA
ncbi:glutathione S-transferase N-terminal domain-containing protein [uncultured Algimonas sp.]|uniref:glutathione S-transferase N-terminal domain-containing protein n=1 Tax=uncultured Algimonas sp. TaxID=1547920 RepID=UPI0026341C60|nr:glutathione S-transferase N-terminal domain-containing protein [uncultured Algimonas sp.]